MSNEVWIFILATVVAIVIATLPYIFLARQGNIQRWVDYLSKQQDVLRAAKAEYDAWIPVADPIVPEKQRHGLKHLSFARSVMLDLRKEKLKEYANKLNLDPLATHDEMESNQDILDQAAMFLADLLSKAWKNAGK